MAEKEKKPIEDVDELLPDINNIKSSETFTLPSKGLCYKPEDNIPASITLRRMTTKEEKMRIRNQSEDIIRRDILQACITTPNIDANKLKLLDANFLLFRLRALSLLDDTYKITCRCINCQSLFVHEIKLSEVPVKYLTKKALDNLNVELPVSKHKITLKFPTLGDIISKSAKLREFFGKFPSADRNEALYTLTGLLYVDKVNNQILLPEELEEYLDSMDIIDNKVFRQSISNIDSIFGFDADLHTTCPNCKTDVNHGLPITEELFSPSK